MNTPFYSVVGIPLAQSVVEAPSQAAGFTPLWGIVLLVLIVLASIGIYWTMTHRRKCPACGNPRTGKFCARCGAG